MRLATFAVDHRPSAAVLDAGAGTWRDLGQPLEQLLRDGTLDAAVEAAAAVDAPSVPPHARRLAPLVPRAIVAVGLNYRSHAAESGFPLPEQPLLFGKLPGTVVGSDAPVEIDPGLMRFVDWEVELAAVIGRTVRDVAQEDALDHVLGWTVANDVSARDVQHADTQWLRGKSFDTFCPLGPELVTTDELGDPQRLALWTEVGGERVQGGTTADMVFGVAELIAWCSRQFTLHPGDLLLTGTPAGVGIGFRPPRSLSPGDVVTCGVEGIGELVNPVIERRSS